MTGAVFCFTMIDTSAKYLALGGVPILQIVLARYLGHFLFAVAVFLPRGGRDVLRSRAPHLQLLRAAILCLGTALNFYSLAVLPLTIVTTIFFAGPIVVTLLSIPMLGERVGPHRIGAVVVGFAGVVVVLQPWGAQFHPAMFLTLGSMCCAATYFVLTRKLAGVDHNATSQIWTAGFASAVMLPVALPVSHWPETRDLAIALVLIGGFGLIGHALLTIANRFAEASALAPVVYTQLVFATAAGLLVFGTRPTVWTALGAAIIIGSGLYIWRRERGRARPVL